MNKRVNITYSVEFDQILTIMRDLIDKSYNSEFRSMDEDFINLLASFDNDNEKAALQGIEEIRKKMMNLDLCLNDCFSIIAEYQKTLIVPPKEEKNDTIR